MTKTTVNLTKINPAPGYVLIEPEEQTKQTTSGIYLPDSASGEKPQQGKVLALGLPVLQDGKETKCPADKNSVVIYKKWGGNEVKVDNKEYLLVKFEDILATIS